MKNDARLRSLKITHVLLLLLLAAAVTLLAKACRGSKLSQAANPAAISLEASPISLTLRRTGDHAQLSLTARFTQTSRSTSPGANSNTTPTPIRLEPPLVSLQTPAGAPIPRYLGPLLPEPILTVPPGQSQEITLHWWLSLENPSGNPALHVSGKTISLPPLPALTNLPEGQTVPVPLR